MTDAEHTPIAWKAAWKARAESIPYDAIKMELGKIKPSHEAQKIRSALAFKLDGDDVMPDYVWDIVDIAVQITLSVQALRGKSAKPSGGVV